MSTTGVGPAPRGPSVGRMLTDGVPRGHVPGPLDADEPDGPWWRRLSALNPGRAGLRALAVVAALVATVAAFLAWQARPDVSSVPPSVVDGGPTAVVALPASAPSTVAPSGEIVVSVAGRVRRPGLVRLPAGARVADALEAAGGALPGTDLTYLNLARKVADGELVVVGVTPPPGVAIEGGGGSAGAGAAAGPVNLNTATIAQLQTLPGVGPVLAQRILDYRTAHGGFRSVGDLRQVSGIGDTRFAQLKDLVTT
ncbi:helix-hairpin-helix domain-containing protein [Luedemannella flava]